MSAKHLIDSENNTHSIFIEEVGGSGNRSDDYNYNEIAFLHHKNETYIAFTSYYKDEFMGFDENKVYKLIEAK